MKTIVSLCAIALTIVGAEEVLKEENREVIQNEQQFKEFYACMLDQDPCPDKLKTLREVIPKYIATNCTDCAPKEKEMFDRFSHLILEKYPKEHKQLMDKFGLKAQ